jgi:hypothetical protein
MFFNSCLDPAVQRPHTQLNASTGDLEQLWPRNLPPKDAI